jgi:hypothetical protein
MQATVEEVCKILVFAALTPPELEQLQPYTTEDYQQGAIVMQEDDRSYC